MCHRTACPCAPMHFLALVFINIAVDLRGRSVFEAPGCTGRLPNPASQHKRRVWCVARGCGQRRRTRRCRQRTLPPAPRTRCTAQSQRTSGQAPHQQQSGEASQHQNTLVSGHVRARLAARPLALQPPPTRLGTWGIRAGRAACTLDGAGGAVAYIAQVPHPQAGGRGGASARPPPEPREHSALAHVAILQRGRREAPVLLWRRFLSRLRRVFGCHPVSRQLLIAPSPPGAEPVLGPSELNL